MNVVESRLLIETAKVVQSLARAFNTGVGGNAIDTIKLSAAIQYYEDMERAARFQAVTVEDKK